MTYAKFWAGAALVALAACSRDTRPPAETAASPDALPASVAALAADRVADEGPFVPVEQDVRARRNADGAPKVYGGTPVAPGTFPATVAISTGADPYTPRCTGVLIKPDVVLTAAHCICKVVLRPDGLVDAHAYFGPNPRIANSGRFYRIKAYDTAIGCVGPKESNRKKLDLAVVRLKNGGNTQVTPMTYRPSAALIDRAVGYRVVGFGAIDLDAQVFDYKKREAPVVAVSNACRGRKDDRPDGPPDAEAYRCWPGAEIVAGQRASPDACNGDSGGPLLVGPEGTSDAAPSTRFILAGIVSRSVYANPRACGYGGVYERLTPEASAWIDGAIGRLKK